MLTLNPLHDCTWPREARENIRRPVASHDRYERTLAVANEVDPLGRLALALLIARYTARRIDAILHLGVADFLLTPAAIRVALAETGRDENDAQLMPHGAIRWRAEWDKMGGERITPISKVVRVAIEAYLVGHASSWVFAMRITMPDGRTQEQPLSRSTATKWLRDAETAAGLPKLRGGLWHAYRRLWATERKALPDADVAEAGGWTGTKAMKLSYQQATASGVLSAVEGS